MGHRNVPYRIERHKTLGGKSLAASLRTGLGYPGDILARLARVPASRLSSHTSLPVADAVTLCQRVWIQFGFGASSLFDQFPRPSAARHTRMKSQRSALLARRCQFCDSPEAASGQCLFQGAIQ